MRRPSGALVFLGGWACVLAAAGRYDRDLCRPNGGSIVPGKPVTDQQVRAYMQDRQRHSQRVAAARAGFSERTGRRIDADPRLPSQRQPERGRTIPERHPAVQAVTLLRHLQMIDTDTFPDDRVRRTLERRVRDWRALHGAARDVIFRQTPEPGRMALSDFTDATELGVTIAGTAFPHRPFHFVMAYSGWEHAAVAERASPRSPRTSRTRSGPWAASPASTAPTACRRHIATSTRKPPEMSSGVTRPSARTTGWSPAAAIPARPMRTDRWSPTTATSRPPSTRR